MMNKEKTMLKVGVTISLLTLFVSIAAAQGNDEVQVPANVLEAFNILYPKMNDVAWHYREPDFEANFKLDKRDISLSFDEEGFVTEVKNEIREFELPTDVNNLLVKKYSGWKIDKASHIEANGTVYYETVVEKEAQTLVLVFDREGDLMMKVIPQKNTMF